MISEIDIRKYKRHLDRQQIVRRTPVTLGDVLRAWKPMGGVLVIVLSLLALIALVSIEGRSAENESVSSSLPDAPSAVYTAAMVKAAIPPQAPPAHHDNNWLARAVESKPAYRASQLFLVGATVFDAVRTYQGLTHPTHLTASYYIPADNLWIYPNVDMTREFSEGGWAKVFGPRNAAGVVAANVAVSAATMLISHELAKKGPRWRAVGTLLNSGRAAASLAGALSWQGANDYANHLPSTWGYPVQTLQWH